MTDDRERSIGAVLADIAGNAQEIVRAEIRLAKTEVRAEISTAGRGAMFLAAGGGAALLALGLVSIAGVLLLATVVALWIAALIVAAGVAVIGALLIAAGLKQLRTVTFAMPRTVATLKENFAWQKPSTK